MAAATAQQWRVGCHACSVSGARTARACADASRLAAAVELLFFRIGLDRNSFFLRVANGGFLIL